MEDILDDLTKDVDVENNLASKGQRFGNYVVDIIIFYILAAVFGVALGLSGSTQIFENEILIQVIVVSLLVIYYLFFEFYTGKTIGKYITKTRVVTESGGKPTFGQCLGRTFSRLVPFEAFSLLSETGVGWHDSWSKTRVIKD